MTFITYLFIALLILFAGYLLFTQIIHYFYRAPRLLEITNPGDFGLTYQSVTIPTQNNKQLFAWYVPASDQSVYAPAVVVMHGWGGNAEFMLPFADILHGSGYAVLLVDARNHGRSDSDTFSSMPRFAEDLDHSCEWMANQPGIDRRRIALLGHSVGAGAALLAASRRQGIAAVVSIAAFSRPDDLMRRQMQANHIPYRPIGWAALRYIEHTIGTSYESIAPANTIGKIKCPVLLVHGNEDQSVPVSDAEFIYAQRKHENVKLLIVPHATHNSVKEIKKHANALIAFLDAATKTEYSSYSTNASI